MKPVLFADLDDTLFRSRARLTGLTTGMTQATVAANGNHSWMTPRQARFVEWALSALEIIPVTARSTASYARVSLKFPGLAVLSNGAVILDAEGRPDDRWAARTHIVSQPFKRRLGAMLAAVQGAISAETRAWIVQEQGDDIYLCVKSNNTGSAIDRDLDRAEALVAGVDSLEGLLLHRNGNNLSITPRDISKAAAVRHLLQSVPGMQDRVLLSAGDALSDLPFMGLADFMLVPPASQISGRLASPTPEARGLTKLSAAPDPRPRGPAAGSAGSGSYEAADVRFLLDIVDIPVTEIATKEALIQSGTRHYSEMISTERRPDARYLAIFENACLTGIPRMAAELAGLADALALRARSKGNRIALCSLVRAGVPYGVILLRRLQAMGVDASHYGVSIIRDRGLDSAAVSAILAHHATDEVVFIDGWTGKGAIAAELDRSWRDLTGLTPCLAVLADPCGRASLCGSHEDWLIPSGILGGCISGMVSRSIRIGTMMGPGDFDGCLRLDDLREVDRSRWFVDAVWAELKPIPEAAPIPPCESLSARLLAASEHSIVRVLEAFNVTSRNLIKPGIAEATRAVLRRRPHKVILRAREDPDLPALHYLCAADGIDVIVDAEMTGPYRAITVIERSL